MNQFIRIGVGKHNGNLSAASWHTIIPSLTFMALILAAQIVRMSSPDLCPKVLG